MNLRNKSTRKVIIWEVAKKQYVVQPSSVQLTWPDPGDSSYVSLGLVIADWSQLAKHYVISLFRKVPS